MGLHVIRTSIFSTQVKPPAMGPLYWLQTLFTLTLGWQQTNAAHKLMETTLLPLLRAALPGSNYWRLQPTLTSGHGQFETDKPVLAALEREAAAWVEAHCSLLDEVASSLCSARASSSKLQ